MEKNNSLRRRKVVKTIGSGLAVAGFGASGTVTATERSLKEIYQTARKIRQKSGSQEQFVEYLQKHLVGVERSTQKFKKKARNSSDGSGVSTQKVKDTNLTAQFVLGGDYTHTVADYHVEINGDAGTGEAADDAISISWKPNDYDLVEGGTFKNDARNATLKQSGFNGALWTFNDGTACQFGCNNLTFSLGTRMKRLTTETPRKVQATYQSVWNNDTFVTGMTVSSDGTVSLNVTTSSETNYEQIDRNVEKESFETNL